MENRTAEVISLSLRVAAGSGDLGDLLLPLIAVTGRKAAALQTAVQRLSSRTDDPVSARARTLLDLALRTGVFT